MESSKAMAATFFSALLFLNFVALSSAASLNVTALFAFGDSTIDPGNNNHLATVFKSDHAPYGKIFPNHTPTGRFSDGKLVTDFLASWLGLKPLLPAYLDPNLTDSDLITGVSFASAGSGIDELTPKLVNVLSIDQQLNNFHEAIKRIETRVGASKARQIINDAVYLISAGTNDVVFNFYVLPITRRRLQFHYKISKYHDFLLEKLQGVVENLYNKGARRIVVAGLPPVGCLPFLMSLKKIVPGPGSERACLTDKNHDSERYNHKVQTVVSNLNSRFEGIKVSYGDIYTPLADMMHNPSKHGFDSSVEGCCGLKVVVAGPLCNVLSPMCHNSSRYLFWDAIHPTEAAYTYLAHSLEKSAFN